MNSTRLARSAAAFGTVLALSGALAGCSASGGGDGKVEITFATGTDTTNATFAQELIAAFEAENPDISVELTPQASEGSTDNIVKTKLSTGTMEDVFYYNSGSLLQALAPDKTLVDLSDQDWVGSLTDDFKAVVSTDNGLYGAPIGTSLGGGIMYNYAVYEDLGLSIPTSWAEFEKNNDIIKAAGITAVEQTYGDTWTSQLIILADFANIEAQEPDWATDYTANAAKYADAPAFASWEHLQQLHDAGVFNEDYASATAADGLLAIAEGRAAHYPMLSALVSTIAQNSPDLVDAVGFFALPADDADDTQLTVWQPSALYIPQTTTGAKLEAAKKFIAFANSQEGCAIQSKVYTPSGPYVTSQCSLPDEVPSLLNDLVPYFDSGKTAPALEFLSPVKGPNLEGFAVEVGSGLATAEDAAARYDEDVKKQAQQLGLEGW